MKFDEYEQVYASIYTEFAELVRALLQDAIKKVEGLPRPQTTQARAKDVKSLERKLQERGLLASEHIESELKDLAGARLIFYTNTDVDRFLNAGLIADIFDVDLKETRVHHPTDENDQRRYQAIHYTVLLREQHTALPAYEKFKGMRCEIQIQTILNHAWSETQHDMVYHAADNQGFGTAAKQVLDKRLKKIMDEYLRPAGYELQKVQYDYERLMQGKALFDRGAIETLENCGNNNERHEILSTLAEHVIPNYDDIRGVYPEIRRTLETAVLAARNTETKPIETPFGNLPGKTPKDVILMAVGIINTLRYVDIEATFRLLIDVYKGERYEEVCKQIVDTIKQLAKYHLNVWEQAGPYVQTVLADVMGRLSQDDLHLLRPIALVVWHELLKSEMESASFSGETLTITSRALFVFEDIKDIRNRAIDGLIALFDSSSTEEEKREVVAALHEAARLPGQANCPNELLWLTLEDMQSITELLTQRAPGQPYELLEYLEHEMRFDYWRVRPFAADEHDKSGCQQRAKNVMKAIITFRDLLNADQQYVRYKTLVGYESIFPFHWENEAFDYTAVTAYRKAQATLYIDEVSDETADEWYCVIQRCASTKSNDRATFPVFMEFIHQLSKTKPNFVCALVRRDNTDVLAFLPMILDGLRESEARDIYAELIEDFLDRNPYLVSIAHHCRRVKKDAADTVEKILDKAIAGDRTDAIFECLIFAIQQHDAQELPLVDNVFIPAITYLIGKRDAQWIHGAYYLPECTRFFNELPPEHVNLVLENLLALNRIDYHAECILTPIAMNQPASVMTFFEWRARDGRDREDRYEAIPYQLHSLPQQLARDVDSAIAILRRWYRDEDLTSWVTGKRLQQAILPAFTDGLASSLNQMIANGSDEDCDFVIHVLENYHNAPPSHEVIKELIDRLPENDPRLHSLEACLSKIGIVSGKFGMVAAFRRKKEEISSWQKDSRPKVRDFATSYIKKIEQQIANEQRSAEMRQELRKRNYEANSE